MRVLARANVQVDGRLLPWGTVADVEPSSDVSTLVAAGLLAEEAPDGSFPEPPQPERRRCCGG